MEKIKKIAKELKKHNPKKILLFGSRAIGDNLKNSDIDIAADLTLTFREKRKLREKIDDIAGIYSVDLVFFDEISEEFKNRILQEGKEL